MAGYEYIGHTNVFDENVEQWTTYVERFEHFVKANDIEEDKKAAVFPSVMGAATYGLLRSLIAPDKPREKSYEDPRAMDQVLQGLPNVHCYLDDILITGKDRVQHLKNLDAVLGTPNKVERNYAQIEREALSINFGVRKFHHYLYGRKFTLLTDHRTLTTILSPSKAIPSMAAARMQQWALLLAAHDYTIQYREASHHGNGDGLSRLPIPTSPKEKSMAVDRFHIRHLEVLPVNCKEIYRESRTDRVLAQVVEMVSKGPGWRQHTGTIHQQKE
ncbi:hypothetical protein AOLI_G00046350 [Acnodon oligacanthus]